MNHLTFRHTQQFRVEIFDIRFVKAPAQPLARFMTRGPDGNGPGETPGQEAWVKLLVKAR